MARWINGRTDELAADVDVTFPFICHINDLLLECRDIMSDKLIIYASSFQ